MKTKIVLSALGLVAVFLGYVSTREGKFKYSVTRDIQAPVDEVYPYVSDLKRASQWSPFEKADPNMKKEYTETKLTFAGNSEVGAGSVEIIKAVPNAMVELKLIMTAPIKAENMIEYRLAPIEGGTRFTWSMSGDGGFMGKLMSVFIDCEKMMTEQFIKGIEDLKVIVEHK